MKNTDLYIYKRIKIAGIFSLIGILLVVVSLYWNSPASFLFMNGLGVVFVFIGITIYLLTLIRFDRSTKLPSENTQ